jgi:hypothetical protein
MRRSVFPFGVPAKQRVELRPSVREDKLGERALERDHRARPQNVADVEVIGRPATRVVGGELATRGAVVLELEEVGVAIVDPTVAVPVVAPAREAELETELRVGCCDREVAIDGFEVRGERQPDLAALIVVEVVEVIAAFEHLGELADQRVAR